MIFEGDRDYIGPYLRYLADQIGLRDWTVNVLGGAPDDTDHAAEVDVRYGRKWANISFALDWFDQREETFRSTCVHELLHCHFQNIWEPLNSMIGIIGSNLYQLAYDGMKLHIEHAVDAVAEEWGRLLPLPSEWLEQATEPEVA